MPIGVLGVFRENARLIVFIPILVLLAFLAFNYVRFSGEQPPEEMRLGSADDLNAPIAFKRACPFECCPEGEYEEKACGANLVCVENACAKKQCPYECCDDESYAAEFGPKPCGNGLYCSDNSCALRKCYAECCAKAGFEEKPCDGNKACNEGVCEKPACPEQYKCCAANDSLYKEKKCTGNLACKFRTCLPP